MRQRRQLGSLRGLTRVGRLALGVALLAPVGCHDAKRPPEGVTTALPPVEPPANLLAEATIASPDPTWLRLERGIGGEAGILPTTMGGVLSTTLGIDARLGAEISGASPAYLVVAGPVAAPSWVLAARLVEERRARPLFEGPGAIFQQADAGGGVVLLTGKQTTAMNVALGVASGGWLVIGRSPEALAALSPYATRTLPSKARGPESITIDIPGTALKGDAMAAASRTWSGVRDEMSAADLSQRAAHGGRAPDFGDPRAIMGTLDGWVQARIATLGDLRGVHVAVDVKEDTVSAVLTASPASANGPAAAIVSAIRPGDVAPLASAPRDAVLALLTRDDAAARAKDAADLETTLATTLGPRLGAAEAKQVHAAIDDWRNGRGDWATLALRLGPTARGVVADVASSDPPRTAQAVHEAMDLVAHVPAIREPLEAWLRARSGAATAPGAARSTLDVTLGAADLPGGARASTALFGAASPFSLAWTTGQADVRIALAAAPLPFLTVPAPGETLADDPAIAALLGSIGNASTAIFAQPGKSPGCTAAGGIVAAWGRRTDDAGQAALWGTVAATDSSLRCLAGSLF